jgi:hypothetical protein
MRRKVFSFKNHVTYNQCRGLSSNSLEGPVVVSDGYLDPRQVHDVEKPFYHDLVFPPKPHQMELRTLKQRTLATYANETRGIQFI